MIELPSGVTAATDPGGRAVLDLVGPGGSARISRLGAHVQRWRCGPQERDVLFTSREASYAPETATRGGVPVVFPWFGDHPHRPELPAHGFARILDWEVVAAEADAAVTLRLDDSPATQAMWPHRFCAELRLDLRGDGLSLSISVTNRGDAAFAFEEALHTYFAVDSIHEATVLGLEGVSFTEHAKAPEGAWDTEAPIAFRAETDRVFQDVPSAHELRCGDHSVRLDTENSASTIVWNPWIAKAAAMSQMADDEWQEFVCIESANVKERALSLLPGQTHTLGVRIRAK